ncbi:MAG: hypothetical protein CALGDGBN_01928 [Pseudomonadales bacterium]|nr:hypothetical protein [Pseudomonadales bacterium]
MIAAVLRAGGDSQHPRTVAQGDDRGKVGQTFGGDRERVAVRVADVERDLERLAARHALVAERQDEGCAVGVVHGQRNLDRHTIRHTGTVAVVGGREAHRVGPGLHIAWRPVEHPRLGVEARAFRQPLHRDRHAGFGAEHLDELAGIQPVTRHETWIVRIQRERTEADALALDDRPVIEAVEHRHAIHIGDIDAEDRFAAQQPVGGPQRDLVATRLREGRSPFEQTGGRVQARAFRQIRALETHRVAVRIESREAHRHRVALAHAARRYTGDQRRGVGRTHQQRQCLDGAGDAVAGDDTQVRIVARLVMTRQPRKHTCAAVEDRAGRQVVDIDRHHLPIGIDCVDADLEQRTGAQFESIGQVRDRGRRIATVDRNREALLGIAAPRVIHAQHHRRARVAAHRGIPAQHAVGAEGHPLGSVEQHVAEHHAVRIAGRDGVAVTLARGRLRERARTDHRRAVRVRYGVDSIAEIGALALGVGQRDGPHHRRVTRREHAVDQAGPDVEQPQAVVRDTRIERDALEIAARVEHQHQRRLQVVVRDVGHAHVEGQCAVGPVRTGGHEIQPHQAREVLHTDEIDLIRRAERQTAGALHPRGDGERVEIRLQCVETERHGAGRFVPRDAGDRHRPAVGPTQRVVLGIQHRARARGARDVHVLVEHHPDARQRQRHHDLVGRRRAHHRRRRQRHQHIDLLRVGDQHPSAAVDRQRFGQRPVARDLDALQRR